MRRLLTFFFFVCVFLKVNQRNVPGIDNAYLAMDTEEGVEVVWNEVMFSERKNFKLQEVGDGPWIIMVILYAYR